MIDSVCLDTWMDCPDFTAALSRVCQAINWDYGEVWILNPERKLLELSPVWYGHLGRCSDRLETIEKFRACSEQFVLSIGEGLPGRIWQSCQAEWIEDVSIQSESYFLRNQIAKAFDLKAGFGFPVFCNQAIIGTFVFFTDCAYEEDPRLVQRAIAVAMPLEHEEFYIPISGKSI